MLQLWPAEFIAFVSGTFQESKDAANELRIQDFKRDCEQKGQAQDKNESSVAPGNDIHSHLPIDGCCNRSSRRWVLRRFDCPPWRFFWHVI